MSVQYTILTSVRDIIDDLGVGGLTAVVRKDLIVTENDTFPLVVIAPGRPEIDEEYTEDAIVWRRPVYICIVENTGEGLIESSIDTLLTLEDRVRKALHKPTLFGADTVFDADISPDSLFIPAGVKSGYDITIFRVDFLSEESRSS